MLQNLLVYIGSIAIDSQSLEKDGTRQGERLLVVEYTNRARLETYVIKGNLPLVGSKVAIDDDVISTGAAIFRAIGIIEGKGYKVAKVRAILDRQLGGSKELQRKGYDFRAILRADAFGKIYINK